jgi:hypothetical protein
MDESPNLGENEDRGRDWIIFRRPNKKNRIGETVGGVLSPTAKETGQRQWKEKKHLSLKISRGCLSTSKKDRAS